MLTTLALLATAPLAAQTPTQAPAPAAKPKVVLTAEQEANLLTLGKKYTQWFLAGQADSLSKAFDETAFERMGGMAGMVGMMEQIAERAGFEKKIVEEKMTYRNGQPQFWHAGEFSEFADDELVIRWIFTIEGKITGAGIQPKSAAPAPDPLL